MRYRLPGPLAPALIAAALSAASALGQVNVTVDATTAVRKVDDRMFGLNTAVWDGSFTDAQTLTTLQTVDARFLRYPGGSSSDDYNWQTNTNVNEGTSAGTTTFDDFAAYAKAIGAQVIITVNYGTGTPEMAAAWVTYSNVTKGYGFKYWEVGNECYGTWEDDNNSPAHNGVEYATRAVQYIKQMRAADPTIKVGVVADASEDSYSNGAATSVTNPVTGASHSGFTPLMLATMKNLGTLPDFLIYHNYPQNPPQENDAFLLQNASTWKTYATELRTQLTDYLGTAGAGIELLDTENNSVSSMPGKQTTSLVNGLYYADSMGSLMQTEFNGFIWWALHNGPSSAFNNSTSLYGWRLYGDYGIENGDGTNAGSSIYVPAHDPYPVYYVQKLLTHFARGGDTVLTASSNNTLLTPYAVKRQDGSLSVLVINKSPTATYSATFAINGFTPQSAATVYSYGIPQDEYSEENTPTSIPPATGYSWENSLDGWVNQSGQPDDKTTNYGLDAPYLYSLAYSTSTGVTDGMYSLACTTTASNPGNSAVIQNSTASLGAALSAASSVSLDIYPQVAAGTTVQASVYINGTVGNYVLLGTVTLSANTENTETFPITAAQRSNIQSSLVAGDYFQIGININSPAPLTVFLDNFKITPAMAPTPTPTPTPIAGAASSADVAVTTISNSGPSFSASFAPYSATVISLTSLPLSPVASSQPASQTIATGSSVAFSFTATGSPAPTYQWYLGGAPIASATSSTLVVSGATASNAGSYYCVASNPSGTTQSNPATLSVVSTSNPGRLINLSCRAQVGTGGNVMIAGFVVGGAGTSGSQNVLVRGSGPALSGFGLTGVLPDPKLTLTNVGVTPNVVVATNQGWGGTAAIASAASAAGAFAWSASSLDSALLESLPATNYTAEVSGAANDTGVALVEVYDATPAGTYTPTSARLTNLSARVQVGTGGNVVFAGFVIGGSTSKTVLIRATGPTLANFGLTGVLADPKLTLTNVGVTPNVVMATDTGWQGDPSIMAAAASVGAFGWSSTSADSALLVTLPPGNYTAGVAGASGDTGIALVELYELQ